jgi:signal recognition particle GTPase
MDYSFCVNRSDWIFIGKIEVELHKKKKPKCKTRQNAQQKTELKTKLKPKSKLESTLKSKPKSIKKSCKFEAIKRRLNHCGKSKPRVTLVNNKFAKNPTYKELIENLYVLILQKDYTTTQRNTVLKLVWLR